MRWEAVGVQESVAQGVGGLVMCDGATGFNRRCVGSEGSHCSPGDTQKFSIERGS